MGKQLRKLQRKNISKYGKKPYVPGKTQLGSSDMYGLAPRKVRRAVARKAGVAFVPQPN